MAAEEHDSQRLDRWLWAARFFKTRASASGAVRGGKVTVDGDRPKPARRIRSGSTVVVERGATTFEVVVKALNEQRCPASEAVLLYEETPRSVERRSSEAARREQAEQRRQRALGRPDRRDRRAIVRLKGRGEP